MDVSRRHGNNSEKTDVAVQIVLGDVKKKKDVSLTAVYPVRVI